MIREAEEKRVREWRAKQMSEIDTVWKEIDTDDNGTLDPTELGQVLVSSTFLVRDFAH